MSKEWDNFKSDYKKLQPKIKKYTTSDATKMHASLKKTLKDAWKAEDSFRQTISKAKESDRKTVKLADFMKDKGFKLGHTNWNKAVDTHRANVKTMIEFCGQAADTHKQMNDLLGNIIKDLRESKESASSKKEIENLKTSLTKETAEMKKTKNAIGKLNAPEKLYAVNFKRTVDSVLKDCTASKSDNSETIDLPKLMDPRILKKNLDSGVKLAKSIAVLCGNALEKAPANKKDAISYLKKAEGEIKKLKKIDDKYKLVQKKFMSKIKAERDGKKTLATMKKLNAYYLNTQKKIRETGLSVKKAVG